MKTNISVKNRTLTVRRLSCLNACLLISILQLNVLVVQAKSSYTSGNSIFMGYSRSFIPTKIMGLSAFGNNGRVSIGWKVANEKDQFEYIIERSMDGVDFVPVGTLIYKQSITPINNYSFTDLIPVVNHVNYYRVRSVDLNGRSALSPVVKVKLATPVGSLTINPAPADASATLSLVSKARGTVSIRILNSAGRSCWHLHYSVVAGPNVLILDGLDKLPEGAYTVQCIDGRKTRHVQLLIHHEG